MIKVIGSIERDFTFPGEPASALNYYSELERIAQYMPHIELVEVYNSHQIRVLYATTELGSYDINIYCDLQCKIDTADNTFTLLPLEGREEVPAKATLNSTMGQGMFALQARFTPNGAVSHVDYIIQLKAMLPRPLGMRLMPRRVVNRIAQNITDSRIREIADGFISDSVAAYPAWQKVNAFTG